MHAPEAVMVVGENRSLVKTMQSWQRHLVTGIEVHGLPHRLCRK